MLPRPWTVKTPAPFPAGAIAVERRIAAAAHHALIAAPHLRPITAEGTGPARGSLADRELGKRPGILLPFGTRQLGPKQLAMHRTVGWVFERWLGHLVFFDFG